MNVEILWKCMMKYIEFAKTSAPEGEEECPQCGAIIDESYNTCPECGYEWIILNWEDRNK